MLLLMITKSELI